MGYQGLQKQSKMADKMDAKIKKIFSLPSNGVLPTQGSASIKKIKIKVLPRLFQLSEYMEAVTEHPVGIEPLGGLINPILLDDDFKLQHVILEAMMPSYFFAAGHMNYACYMTWYLRNVEHLPTAANSDLLKGAHVCRHSDGGTAGRRDGGTAVPADQFGEPTFFNKI